MSEPVALAGLSVNDQPFVDRVLALAEQGERSGNLPIGAVIVLDGQVVAEAHNAILSPNYHPGRHAEMQALGQVPAHLWDRAAEMTCYSTLEPCLMCYGALLLHGVGRIVYCAHDIGGGAGCVQAHLPDYYRSGGGRVPLWIGPVAPHRGDALFARARALFDRLPCGKA